MASMDKTSKNADNKEDLHENMAMHMINTHGRDPKETHRSYEELKAEHDGLECR